MERHGKPHMVSKRQKLADRLRYSVHQVITGTDDEEARRQQVPLNERKLFAVQMTQADLDVIMDALVSRASEKQD